MELKKINILLMPTDMCNMSCVYCFHECFHSAKGCMDIETLDRLYEISCRKCNNIQFVWHGGEPLIMGLDFYKYAFAKQKEYSEVKIRNTMQSNLTLLSSEMADLLCENRVGIGTSFDGIYNEKLRGNSLKILRGRQMLLDRGANCGVIMVVSNKNIETLVDSYEFFKENSINYSINTYVSRGKEHDGEFEINVAIAKKYFIDFFDYWVNDQECNIHVEYFERMLKYIACGEKTVCKNTSCIGRWVGVRYDGTIVPCNRYFSREYNFGNIREYDSIFDAFDSPGAIKLISEAIERRKKCAECIAYGMCEGGCNNVAYNEGGIKNNGGTTCRLFKDIYTYVSEFMSKHEIYKIKNPMVRTILRKRNRHLG